MEHEQELREFMISSAKEMSLSITEEQGTHFMSYLAHLIIWNKTINLTAITDPKEIIIKHFLDSLAVLIATSFNEPAVILDVGSGGGFPGIPLKIMRPDLDIRLVEPIQKKCSFLNSVIGILKLRNLSVFSSNLEQYAIQLPRQVVDMIVLRGLKFEKIVKHASTLLVSKGKIVLYRAEALHDNEIDDQFHLINETTLALPCGSGKRVLSVIQKYS